MLLKSFVALELILELDFEIDMTALCSENSNESDESPLFDYVEYFESTWVGRGVKPEGSSKISKRGEAFP